MNDRYDIAIIGSGPAGLSAAINAKIRNKKIIIFGNKDLSSKLMKAPKINNYLGLQDISGIELKSKFEQHIKSMSIDIITEKVNNVYAMGDYFALMVKNEMYESKTVILATGMEFTKPLMGEEKLLGKGVGYCATCDAPLYRDKVVTIIGYNKESEEEANYVSELASIVNFIPMHNGVLNLKESIKVIREKPLEILGNERVNGLQLSSNKLATDAVFVLKDSISAGQLVPGILMEDGHIIVDRNMKTNIEGCFAAGDCIGKPYQYIKAAGEGLVAAFSAVSFVDANKGNS